MDVLTRTSVIVAIAAGTFGIVQGLVRLLARPDIPKHAFEREYRAWKSSRGSHLMPHDTYTRLVPYILETTLDPERSAFALFMATHFGDSSMQDLAKMNADNPRALPLLFRQATGRGGVRVGWRAEYVLARLNRERVLAYIRELQANRDAESVLDDSIERILSDGVIDYLRLLCARKQSLELQLKAREVLAQLGVECPSDASPEELRETVAV